MPLLYHLRGRFARRLLVVAALACFLAGTIGIPLFVPISQTKDRSQPYPCMNHPCGCASAEACWRSCCCFTNGEKLAWAAKHGVTPPQYVFAAAAQEKAAAAQEKVVRTTGSCCQTTAKTCSAPKKSCCDVLHFPTPDVNTQSDQAASTTAQEKETWSIGFISAVQARRCQGHAELWLALGAVAPPPAHFELQLTQTNCGHVANLCPSLAGVSLSPATPPPRA